MFQQLKYDRMTEQSVAMVAKLDLLRGVMPMNTDNVFRTSNLAKTQTSTNLLKIPLEFCLFGKSIRCFHEWESNVLKHSSYFCEL